MDFRYLTGFHGLIDTNLGKGAIFDLVLDDDGRYQNRWIITWRKMTGFQRLGGW